MSATIFIILTTLMTIIFASVDFRNHHVLRIPKIAGLNALLDSHRVDVWRHGKKDIDIRVSPSQLELITQFMTSKNAEFMLTILDSNIQSRMDAERLSQMNGNENDPFAWHHSYHRHSEINKWLSKQAEAYPELISYESSIGKSVQGRNISMVRITSPNRASNEPKKQILFQALQHAREWIAAAVAQYFVTSIVQDYIAKEPLTMALLERVEFIIVPVVNPDGYEYSWDVNRLWRKNRGGPLINGTISGVDLNRNWPDHWGVGLASKNPLDETYIGPEPFSEPEARALANLFRSLPNLVLAIDFHSYSQLLLRPFGWTTDPAPFEIQFANLTDHIRNGIMSVNGTKYVSERAVDLYPASGVDDWWNGEGVKVGERQVWGLTIELCPGADGPWEGGFVLDASRIISCGKEMWQGMRRGIEWVVMKDNILGPKTE